MRTSYFRDIAESLARKASIDRMSNGSYASNRGYYPNMDMYFQDQGNVSMEVARRPSQDEFFGYILRSLPAAWQQMSPQDAWNAFQQMPVVQQVDFAKKAGITWQDATSIGNGLEGRSEVQPNALQPGQVQQTTLPAEEIYDSLYRLRDLPLKPDGTFITRDEWLNLPVQTQGEWARAAGIRSQERAAQKQMYGQPVKVITQGTTSGYNEYTPPTQTPGSVLPGGDDERKPKRKTGTRTGTRKTGKGSKLKTDPKTTPPASTQGTSTEYRGIPTQDLYVVPKKVLGGPNSILDFFGNARGGSHYLPKGQNGHLMYSDNLDKAGIGNFFKGVGRTIHDYGRGMMDSFGNMTGLYDLSNEKYKTKFGQKYSDKIDKFSRGIGSVGRMAADVFLPGAGTGLSMLGSALNPQGLGAKQQQRDMAKASYAAGMGFPNMGGQSSYNPSGQEQMLSALAPGLASLLPSLLSGPQSPGGARGAYGTNIGDPGVYAQGGMPVALMRHMDMMSIFDIEDDYSRGTGPYLVY